MELLQELQSEHLPSAAYETLTLSNYARTYKKTFLVVNPFYDFVGVMAYNTLEEFCDLVCEPTSIYEEIEKLEVGESADIWDSHYIRIN